MNATIEDALREFRTWAEAELGYEDDLAILAHLREEVVEFMAADGDVVLDDEAADVLAMLSALIGPAQVAGLVAYVRVTPAWAILVAAFMRDSL